MAVRLTWLGDEREQVQVFSLMLLAIYYCAALLLLLLLLSYECYVWKK